MIENANLKPKVSLQPGGKGMTESITSENPQVDAQISVRDIIGTTGYALSIAALFMGVYSTVFTTALSHNPTVFALFRGEALLFGGLFYAVLYRFLRCRDSLVQSKRAKAVFLAMQLSLPLAHLIELLFGLTMPLPFLVVTWALWGLATSYFSCSWADALSTAGDDKISSINFVAFLGASLVVACVLAMPGIYAVLGYIVVILGSFVSIMGARCSTPVNLDGEGETRSGEKWMHERVRFRKQGSYVMVVDGILIANIACLLIAKIIRLEFDPVLMGGALAATTLIFALMKKWNPSTLSLNNSQLIFLPIMVGCLVIMILLDGFARIAAGVVLFIALYLFEISNSASLVERLGALAISPSFCYAKGRIFITIGQCVGWFIGAFLTSTDTRYVPFLYTVFIVLVCLYATITTLWPKEDPVVEEAASIDRDLAATSPSTAKEPQGKPFKDKCTRTAFEYDLTPREAEILFYLAKGRNAKYIAEKFFVAERTIKTHTYHIYQKMGIHSRQELINIIDGERSE